MLEDLRMNIVDFYRKKIYPNIYKSYHTLNAIRYCNYGFDLLEQSYIATENLHFKKIMRIENGEFTYEYFNFCYLHNILSLMLYAAYHHAYPQIYINETKHDLIHWEWYFHQPFEKQLSEQTLPAKICPIKFSSFQPHFKDVYQAEHIRLWGKMYKIFVHLNDQTRAYVENEYQTIFKDKSRVLGVLCRGTDYLRLRPAGHPVQPDINDVITLCRKKISEDSYEAIYLATEEKQIRDKFADAFPNMVLENKRTYYDNIYYKNNIQYIKDVHFERENNNYWRGLEYLSSIILLSRCTSLIGGNCGGTLAALFLNDGNYQYTHIFDLGLYP